MSVEDVMTANVSTVAPDAFRPEPARLIGDVARVDTHGAR
jgi:hypothetical protein